MSGNKGQQLPSNIRIQQGPGGAKHIFINSSTYRHTYGPDGKVMKSTVTENNRTRDITGIPHYKVVDNKFNITGSKFEHVAIGNTGKTEFNTTNQTFEKGAVKQDYKISGGNFVGSNIGGNSRHENIGSTISAGDSSGAPDTKELWNYDVNQTVLDILNLEVTAEQLLVALKKGLTLQKFLSLIKDKPPKIRQNLINSMMQSSADDMQR